MATGVWIPAKAGMTGCWRSYRLYRSVIGSNIPMPTWRSKNVQMLVEIELVKNISVRTLVEGYENQRAIRQQRGRFDTCPCAFSLPMIGRGYP